MKRTPLSNLLLHWVLPLLVLTTAGGAVVMLGSQPKTKRKKAPPRVAVPVEVVHARPHDGPLTISASGVVVPFREVDLPTEVSGRVIWKSETLLPGRFVEKGEELLKIDSIDYELEVAKLEQQLRKAEADLAGVEVDKQNGTRLIALAKQSLDLRSREFARVKRLRQDQATSDTELDAVEKLLVEATESLTILENLLRELESQSKSVSADRQLAFIGLEKAKLDLQRTTIRAPFSGVVINHFAEVDSHVEAGDTIASLEDTSKVEVRCSLRKEDIEFLPSQMTLAASSSPSAAYALAPLPVTVKYVRAGRTYCWNGVLSRQDGLGMDQRTRTMPVRIRVDDPLNCQVSGTALDAPPIALVRGMFAQVDLHCQPDRPLLAIPEEAIRPGKSVWVMDDAELKITPVQLVRIADGVAYVESNHQQLTQQSAIIRSPVPGARDGLAVTTGGPSQRAGKGGGPNRQGKRDTASTSASMQLTSQSTPGNRAAVKPRSANRAGDESKP